ncbi:MAG TPA: GntR family transcriptional regulator [Alphaproteobacteria bacterium]|nr:GntR family transcriptional regulator [Alphaproteobacteria bacterium]
MAITWNDDQPIYRQLLTMIISWILDGTYKDGEALPSIRSIAGNFNVNPLTAAKAYQELANIKVVERRRGIGLFLRNGARAKLLRYERERFLTEEWPEILRRMERMNIDPAILVAELGRK